MKGLFLTTVVHVVVADGAGDEVSRVLNYMADHCEDATLASVSEHLGYHPNTVSGLLKRNTGKTFTEMLRHIRM